MKTLNDIACTLNWIEFNSIQIYWLEFQLNFNSTKFNPTIGLKLKRNGMQIGEGIENMLMNRVLEKKPKKT